MDNNNVRKLIDKYKENMQEFLAQNKEFYKWKAVYVFQQNWNMEAAELGQMIWKSFSESENLIENNAHKPISGIVKLCDMGIEGEVVRNALKNLVDNTIDREKRIASFTDTINHAIDDTQLGNEYKLTSTDAIMFLAFIDAENNYMMKQPIFDAFASKIIGAENTNACFNNIKELIKSDTKLLAQLDDWLLIAEKEYNLEAGSLLAMDGKLNILVYDILYSADVYGLYKGLKRARAKTVELENASEDRLRKYQSELERLMGRRQECSRQLESVKIPDLTGITVRNLKYGSGTIEKNANDRITVKFKNEEKQFLLPDCFAKGFLQTKHGEITDLFREVSYLQERINKLDININKLRVMIENQN